MKFNYNGSGVGSFWLFEPTDPKPIKAPIIAFIPGWSATNPVNYGEWFDHLVKQGNIVLYLSYMDSPLKTPFHELTDNALFAFQKAVDELKYGKWSDGSQHVQPDFPRFSIVGHSAGGVIAPNIAARLAVQSVLPKPKVILSVDPGRMSLRFDQEQNELLSLEDLSVLPKDTLLVSVHGDRDRFFDARGKDTVLILASAKNLPPENRLLYFVQSVGLRGQRATHFFPSADNEAYDSGEPAGLNLVPGNPGLSRTMDQVFRVILAQMKLDSLDYELWQVFDEERDVRFDNASWTISVVPFDHLELQSEFGENIRYP
jgi:hypothetical protein